jgi:hypothetical protein
MKPHLAMNPMKYLALALLTLPATARAGAGSAQIHCASASGRTHVDAEVPGDIQTSRISVTVDEKTQHYLDQSLVDTMALNNQDPAQLYPGFQITSIGTTKTARDIDVIAADDSGRFEVVSLVLRSHGPLHGIGDRIHFAASLSGLDPRNDRNNLPAGISLECEYVSPRE